MGRLKDKIAIVTGGAKGLGAEFTRALAHEGAKVFIADIADGTELAREVDGYYAKTDISDPDQCRKFADLTRESGAEPNILVNNAAVYASLAMQRYDEIDPDLWDKVMATNVRGTFNMIRAIGPIMEKRGSGKIINITSGTVYKGLPNMLHYIASKGAITAMTRALSRELGPSGICVNSLAPGLTMSSSILENEDHLAGTRKKVIASRAIQRDGLPQDLIGALIFLASSDSDFVTGQTLVVDGGSVNT
ncbi:MAG: SDR family oxidoreductase [Pseudomonadota bacterium]